MLHDYVNKRYIKICIYEEVLSHNELGKLKAMNL
jgi:hypothetical protein